MATRSPTQTHSYWGSFASGSLPTSTDVEVGDTAFDATVGQLVVATSVSPVVWTAVGAVGPTQVEIDFGTRPSWGDEFTITDATVTTASNIGVWQSGATATGRVGTDQAWDQILLAAAPGTGTFVITAYPFPGPVVGKRKVCYQVF